jgi:transcriptional regulatory protein LEU3
MYQAMSPTQGTPAHHAFAISPTSPTSVRGFKRSASSDEEHENGDDTRPSSSSRRNTAVKRACNECRQQKVRFIPQKVIRLNIECTGAALRRWRLPSCV